MSTLVIDKFPAFVPECVGASDEKGAYRLSFRNGAGLKARLATPAEVAQAESMVAQDAANDAAKDAAAGVAKQSVALLDAIIAAPPVLTIAALDAVTRQLAQIVKASITGSFGK